jgi:hypothetical protein
VVHKSATDISSRRHQSASESANQGPTSNDGACDDEILLYSGVNTKRRGLGGKERHGGNRRTVLYAGVQARPTAFQKQCHEQKTSRLNSTMEQKNIQGPSCILVVNSGCLKTIEINYSGESSESASGRDNSTESDAVFGLETPLLNVPENSPARGQAPSPGASARLREEWC